jgi:DNA primase
MNGDAQQILDMIDIVEVVSQYVKLRRSGKNFVGLCPFHKERTPSFTVSPEKQIFYCFGCREGGNAIHFLMKYERISFAEALEGLASRYGIPFKRGTSSKKGLYERALSSLCDYYARCLGESDEALLYLRRRGVAERAIREFGLGYSDPRKDIKAFLKTTGLPLDIYFATGIVRTRAGKVYDIFRGRVVVPIRDANSKTIGFGGRTIEEGALPKYVNSPESPIFSKGSVLFGIDLTKRSIVERDEVFVVEGYFDLISLYVSGLTNVVASLGTSITEEQLKRLRNYTENVSFMLDPDEAGLRSVLRLIPLVSEMEIKANIVVLPKGYDPDSFVRERGYGALEQILREKRPILDHVFHYYAERYDMTEIENRIGFLRAVTPYLEAIKDGAIRRLYVKKLSNLTGVEEEHFSTLLRGREDRPLADDSGVKAIEKRVLCALLVNPSLIEYLEERGVMGSIREGRLRKVISQMSSIYKDEGRLSVKRLLLAFEDEELRRLVLAAALEAEGHEATELVSIVHDYVSYLQKASFKEEAERITESIKEAERRGDEEELLRLLERKREMILRAK